MLCPKGRVGSSPTAGTTTGSPPDGAIPTSDIRCDAEDAGVHGDDEGAGLRPRPFVVVSGQTDAF